MNNNNKAFTLAEVLITFGIIGIVAAMTLPSIIASYRRKVVVLRLKRTYSVLSQAFERSKADYGDPSGWDLSGYGESSSNSKIITEKFVKFYLVPYLAKIKETKYASWKDYGYKYIKLFSSWSNEESLTHRGQILTLSDGTILQVSIATHNEGTEEDRDDRIIALMIWADVNGLQSPNEAGKDIFAFRIGLTDGKFSFYDNTHTGNPSSNRADIWIYCKRSPYTCGQLILMDNWEMKEDYPWLW